MWFVSCLSRWQCCRYAITKEMNISVGALWHSEVWGPAFFLSLKEYNIRRTIHNTTPFAMTDIALKVLGNTWHYKVYHSEYIYVVLASDLQGNLRYFSYRWWFIYARMLNTKALFHFPGIGMIDILLVAVIDYANLLKHIHLYEHSFSGLEQVEFESINCKRLILLILFCSQWYQFWGCFDA